MGGYRNTGIESAVAKLATKQCMALGWVAIRIMEGGARWLTLQQDGTVLVEGCAPTIADFKSLQWHTCTTQHAHKLADKAAEAHRRKMAQAVNERAERRQRREQIGTHFKVTLSHRHHGEHTTLKEAKIKATELIRGTKNEPSVDEAELLDVLPDCFMRDHGQRAIRPAEALLIVDHDGTGGIAVSSPVCFHSWGGDTSTPTRSPYNPFWRFARSTRPRAKSSDMGACFWESRRRYDHRQATGRDAR